MLYFKLIIALSNGGKLQDKDSTMTKHFSIEQITPDIGQDKHHFLDNGTACPEDFRCAKSLFLVRKSFLQTAQAVELAAAAASSSASLSSFLLRRFLALDFFDVGFGSSATAAAAAEGGGFEAEAAAVPGRRSAGLAARNN